MEPRALKPLSEGVVVIAGVKASNLSDDLRNHPRIVMWDSQSEHWYNKDLPSNARVVFLTRFIGHAQFENLQKQAIKRHITMFHPQGTGMMVKQVKQLLNIDQQVEKKEPTVTTATETTYVKSKLKALIPFIDFEKTNVENSRILMEKAKELGVTSTPQSLANFVGVQRRKLNYTPTKRVTKPSNVSVEMFDNAIKELRDMRQLFIDTMNENVVLRQKLAKFRKLFEE